MAENADLAAQTGEQGNPGEAERPSWLPDNFENEEAFAKSYKELERSFHQTRTELKAQQEKFEEFVAEQQTTQQQYQQQVQQQDIFAQIEQAREMGDIRAETTLQAQLVAQALQPVLQQYQQPAQAGLPPDVVATMAESQIVAKHPGWNDFREQAAEWLRENDYLMTDEALGNPNVLAQRLDIAYKAVNPNWGAEPQAAQDLSSAKQQAQTMSGAGQRQPAPSDNEEWARAIREADIGGFRL